MDNSLGNSKGTTGGMYRPDGSGYVQGDSHGMPNKGTGTAVDSAYGADIGPTAINREGGMGRAAKSDPFGESQPIDPTFGENAVDMAEDRATGERD